MVAHFCLKLRSFRQKGSGTQTLVEEKNIAARSAVDKHCVTLSYHILFHLITSISLNKFDLKQWSKQHLRYMCALVSTDAVLNDFAMPCTYCVLLFLQMQSVRDLRVQRQAIWIKCFPGG